MKRLAALLAILAIAGCQKSPSTPGGTTAAALPVGRYTIVHSPHLEKDTTLLDTVTGRTWQMTEDNSQNEIWQPVQWQGEPVGND